MKQLLYLSPIFLFLCGCEQRTFVHKSISMEPTIKADDTVTIDMNAYSTDLPRRWDIVLFTPPAHVIAAGLPDHDLGVWIFRVVGLPGETISFDDDGVVIDGEPLQPPSKEEITYSRKTPLGYPDRPRSPQYPFIIPEGHYFVLGDNPNSANDSRFWGPLPADQILGKALEN